MPLFRKVRGKIAVEFPRFDRSTHTWYARFSIFGSEGTIGKKENSLR